MIKWNPWYGCNKISSGCDNCHTGNFNNTVSKSRDFDKPIWADSTGAFKMPSYQDVIVCDTSDFFIYEADLWRLDAWSIIKSRPDIKFIIKTKRIDRFMVSLPFDWEDGYSNVVIGVICEDQKSADYRLPILLDLPIKHKEIYHTPMLEEINIEPYISNTGIERVVCAGEVGVKSRVCKYDWILNTREQCKNNNIKFKFISTGDKFIKDNKPYRLKPSIQMEQAVKANIDLD